MYLVLNLQTLQFSISAATSQNMEKQGHLYVQTGFFGVYKTRFVVVGNRKISVYAKRDLASKPLLSQDLSTSRVVTLHKKTFLIRENLYLFSVASLVLGSSSQAEMNDWIAILSRNTGHNTNQKEDYQHENDSYINQDSMSTYSVESKNKTDHETEDMFSALETMVFYLNNSRLHLLRYFHLQN